MTYSTTAGYMDRDDGITLAEAEGCCGELFFSTIGGRCADIRYQYNCDTRRVKRVARTYVVMVALLIWESSPEGIKCIGSPEIVRGVVVMGRPLFWSDKRATKIHSILVGLSKGPLIAVWDPMSSTLCANEAILVRKTQG
jgi:hypothetical protein